MSEHALVGAKASVMLYDEVDKKWIPGGSSPGISKLNIYHHSTNNTFRIVGRKLQDHEVVVNCAIFAGLKYNQATPTFHQWRDSRQVYGLNFVSKEEADRFASAIYATLESLTAAGSHMVPKSSTGMKVTAGPLSPQTGMKVTSGPLSPQPGSVRLNGNQPQGGSAVTSGELNNITSNHINSQTAMNGYGHNTLDNMRLSRPPTGEEYRSHKRQSSGGRVTDLTTNHSSGGWVADLTPGQSSGGRVADLTPSQSSGGRAMDQTPIITSVVGVSKDQVNANISQATPTPPKAPPPPPLALPLSASSTASRNGGVRQGPSVPAKSTTGTTGATAGSVVLGGGSTTQPQGTSNIGGRTSSESPTPPPVNNLATALKSTKLRRVSKPDATDLSDTVQTTPTSATLGRSSSISSPLSSDIMSEMARKLRDRRVKADGETVAECDSPSIGSTGGAISSLRPSTAGIDSPRTDRAKRFQSLTGPESFQTIPSASHSQPPQRPVTAADLETLKHDIISETRKYIAAAQLEIIQVIRKEMAQK